MRKHQDGVRVVSRRRRHVAAVAMMSAIALAATASQAQNAPSSIASLFLLGAACLVHAL
jgi:uncharacterized protein involved in exopolysaccharide biosynthesis